MYVVVSRFSRFSLSCSAQRIACADSAEAGNCGGIRTWGGAATPAIQMTLAPEWSMSGTGLQPCSCKR